MNIDEAIHLALEYQQAGNLGESANLYIEILRTQPDNIDALNSLGQICYRLGNYDLAINCIETALELNPDDAVAHYNLGITLKELNRLDEAIRCFQKSLKINPYFSEAYNNLGFILGQEQGKFNEAIVNYEKAINLNLNYAQAHFNKSSLLLLTGNFKEGLKEYEWRWKTMNYISSCRHFAQPLMNRFDVKGKKILLYSEQGFGDTIQFIRYAHLIAEQGAEVIVECQKELVSILQIVAGIATVVERGRPLPEFDMHCPLLSLPLIFDTTIESIPANIPYITAETTLSKKWRDRIQHDKAKLKIGLVWAGKPLHANDCNRSCSLDQFLPLAQINGITIYSLQKGEASQQGICHLMGMKLVNYTDKIDDFSDTAALIENLDLVISVDTAVAHLAGSLGKPVWTLLPFVPDWRWLLNRKDSPWYPTMKLFRQPSLGDWKSVIDKVLDNLQKKLANA